MKSYNASCAALICILLMFCGRGIAADCTMQTEPDMQTSYGTHLEYRFDTGAHWKLCWHVNPSAGLTLTNIHYAPPGQTGHQLLESASLAQLLFKYDQDTSAQHWLSDRGLGASSLLAPDSAYCSHTEINALKQSICSEAAYLNLLTSARRNAALPRNQWTLRAWSQIGSYIVEQVWHFSEDGEITPAVRLSGTLERFTRDNRYGSDVGQQEALASNATLVSTWRLDLNIGGTDTDDIVEEIEFIPSGVNNVKRSMTTRVLNTETQRQAEPEQFRAWLFRDNEITSSSDGITRIGYLLDPQTSGFSYDSLTDTWATYDLTVTRYRYCEQLASGNQAHCGTDLGEFSNNESLENHSKVVWFSLARQFLPKREDLPAISPRELNFKLIPFDWSASTPFTPPPTEPASVNQQQ